MLPTVRVTPCIAHRASAHGALTHTDAAGSTLPTRKPRLAEVVIWPQCFYLSCFTPGASKLSEVLLWARPTGSELLAGAQPGAGPRSVTSMFGHVRVRSRPSPRLCCAIVFFKPVRVSQSVQSERRMVLFSLGFFLFRFFLSFFFFSPR